MTRSDALMATMPGDSVTVTNWYKQNVYDSSNNKIGEIEDVQFGAGEAPLLVVQAKEPRSKLPYEIPFAEAFLERLDLERKQVWMKLPEGLLEVNAPLAKDEKQR